MSPSGPKRPGMGRALNIVFHQEEKLRNIEEQNASVSHLMNDVRRAVFVHLCANPCDHVRGTARAVGKSPHTATWHLNRLCGAGFLDHAFVNRKRVFWPKAMIRRPDAKVAALLRRPEILNVLAQISKARGITESGLKASLRVKQQNLNVWLKLLCTAKVLEKSGRGKGTTYEVASRFEELVTGYRSRARKYSDRLLRILERDGLLPKKPRFRGSVLTVEITLPSGRETLKLECDPFSRISMILR